jgi:hypothetical protein
MVDVRLPAIMALGLVLCGGAGAQELPGAEFRPRFTSGVDPFEGSCKLRVRIDEEAELIMRGDVVTLRPLKGGPGRDLGSECTAPLPSRGILEFDFRKTDGRGTAEVLERPDRRNHSRVVIRIRDPKNGDDKYTLEFQWATRSGLGGGLGKPGRREPSAASFPVDEAISLCHDVVRGRIAEQHGYTGAEFLRTSAVVGRHEWFAGEATARRGDSRATFAFECNVSLNAGRVLEARVNQR